MKKGVLAILSAALLAVGGGVFVASGTAFAYTICNSTISGPVTLTGPLVVPKGAYCNLQNVTVSGSVQVQSGGTLNIGDHSSIEGSIQSNTPGVNTTAKPLGGGGPSSFSIIVCSSFATGPVEISNAPSAVLIGSNDFGCGGQKINNNGSTGSTGVSLTANHGPTNLDDNHITGSAGVSGNGGTTAIRDNGISGNLNCTANNPPPTGGGNFAEGSKNGQCSGL